MGYMPSYLGHANDSTSPLENETLDLKMSPSSDQDFHRKEHTQKPNRDPITSRKLLGKSLSIGLESHPEVRGHYRATTTYLSDKDAKVQELKNYRLVKEEIELASALHDLLPDVFLSQAGKVTTRPCGQLFIAARECILSLSSTLCNRGPGWLEIELARIPKELKKSRKGCCPADDPDSAEDGSEASEDDSSIHDDKGALEASGKGSTDA